MAYEPTEEQVRVIEAFESGDNLVVEAYAGCLAADTLLNVNRDGKGSEMQIAHIAQQFSGVAPIITRTYNDKIVTQHTKPWNLSIPTMLTRAEGDICKLGKMSDAWSSGIKTTFKLVTESGRTIRATKNHPFMTPNGWFALSELKTGMNVCVNAYRSQWQISTERIVSIERFAMEKTYDVEMNDKPHNFLANGFVVHNSGKTSTLADAAETAKDYNGLYLAYNKAIATDAQGSFPRNTECRTAHSLAFRAVGRKYADRLNGPRIPARVVASMLHIGNYEFSGVMFSSYKIARIASDTLKRFCYSADMQVEPKHVPFSPGMEDFFGELQAVVVPIARAMWKDAEDPKGKLRFEHDYYLKMYGMSNPRLDVDYVMLDEAQDANPIVAHIVESQAGNAQIIMVGDSNQQLYSWRGAEDAIAKFNTKRRLKLSKSFRFGEAIAQEANKWLKTLGNDIPLKGFEAIDSRLVELPHPKAILCRTNATTIAEAMHGQEDGKRVAIVGGTREMKMFADAADELQQGKGTSHPDLAAFKNWNDVQEYVADGEGSDLKVFVTLIDNYGVDTVRRVADTVVEEKYADIIVSTGHKAKGREWDSVRIAPDFQEPGTGSQSDPTKEPKLSKSECQLAYVACTRAKLELDRSGISWIDKWSDKEAV